MGKKETHPLAKNQGDTRPREQLNFTALVAAIRQTHEHCTSHVNRVVNVTLTIRNWAIGWYLREYEQNGADRASYGDGLIDTLAERLKNEGIKDLAARTLRQCRQFYSVYPSIWQTSSADFPPTLLPASIWQTLSAKSALANRAMPPGQAVRPTNGSMPAELETPLDVLLSRISFSHFVELIAIDDPLKRAFYEIECMRGNWSVRALKRQIATLYFERSGLSRDKEKLAALVNSGVEAAEPRLAIRDPYIFEFLGLKTQDAMQESDLEAALVVNLRDFLLELGHGFCLEAQQKSIVIGNTRSFVDLVFYHRILKCHVLVELKVDEFDHESIGQLNTYVTWYRQHMMTAGDNLPVGLLLCTRKDQSLVEYALAAIDNRLFVSKYEVELPSKMELQRFLEAKRRELGG
ncbi:MAG: YhcG family protein [Pirellulaceae bacterium]|nr:YhcG family protein [Pirellulaceae bacterium]